MCPHNFNTLLLMVHMIQTALDVPWAGKCAGENNGSTIDSIVLVKVARGRSSPRTTKNADWHMIGVRTNIFQTKLFADSSTFNQYLCQ